MTLGGKIRYYEDCFSALFGHESAYASMSITELLDLRLCDLQLRLDSALVQKSLVKFEREWQRTGFRWKPIFWYSTEWFHPEGTNGIALPFYLSDPRLMALEQGLFRDCEGKNVPDILKYIRHEAGHIVDKVYQIRYQKKRRDLFGKSSAPYPKKYYPIVYSRKYVRNLPMNYGQTHPDEDFAETFAIWLDPKSNWKKRYKGTALKKLRFIDDNMKSLPLRLPANTLKIKVGEAKTSRMKLKTYYRRRAKAMGLSWATIEKQLHYNQPIEIQAIRRLVNKYLKAETLTNYELRYLLSLKHSPLLHRQQLLSYLQKRNLQKQKLQKREQAALKRLIAKVQKQVEKKGIYYST